MPAGAPGAPVSLARSAARGRYLSNAMAMAWQAKAAMAARIPAAGGFELAWPGSASDQERIGAFMAEEFDLFLDTAHA